LFLLPGKEPAQLTTERPTASSRGRDSARAESPPRMKVRLAVEARFDPEDGVCLFESLREVADLFLKLFFLPHSNCPPPGRGTARGESPARLCTRARIAPPPGSAGCTAGGLGTRRSGSSR
jgi:hypothetical protein